MAVGERENKKKSKTSKYQVWLCEDAGRGKPVYPKAIPGEQAPSPVQLIETATRCPVAQRGNGEKERARESVADRKENLGSSLLFLSSQPTKRRAARAGVSEAKWTSR